MPHRRTPRAGTAARALVVALVGLGACAIGRASIAAAPTLDGETLAGAFVTMTPGARCPSSADVDFSAQGEASGAVDGLFDLRGTLGLTRPEGAAGVDRLEARLDVNQGRLLGTLRWDTLDAPLALSCDPLSFRLDGQARYTVQTPFADAGTVELHAYGSRSAVTAPYFGRVTLAFHTASVR